MKTLSQHRLLRYFISCIHQDKQISIEEVSSAYEEYIVFLSNFSLQDWPAIEKLRQLYYVEVELTALLQLSMNNSDTHIKVYLRKTIHLIKIEIKLIYISLRYCEPKRSRQDTNSASLHWKGSLINLMELIVSLYYSEMITNSVGQHQSFAGLVAAFEKLFNIKISKPYDLRADLARRKKNLSILLPKLKDIYEKNIVNCGVEKNKKHLDSGSYTI